MPYYFVMFLLTYDKFRSTVHLALFGVRCVRTALEYSGLRYVPVSHHARLDISKRKTCPTYVLHYVRKHVHLPIEYGIHH